MLLATVCSERRRSVRAFVPALLSLAIGSLLASSTIAAPAEVDGALSARLVCPPRPGPGRVICEAELEVESGVLAWGDVLVLEAPAFAPPLRSRVGSGALFMKTDQRQRLQLALAATRAGSGVLRVRARAVLCTNGDSRACRPVTQLAEARVQVGPISE